MEKKAKYIRKCYDRFSDAVYLFYEYRGHEYMICDEHNGYSEPMWVKHKNEQERIDREIEDASRPKISVKYEDTAECGFDLFFDFVNQ